MQHARFLVEACTRLPRHQAIQHCEEKINGPGWIEDYHLIADTGLHLQIEIPTQRIEPLLQELQRDHTLGITRFARRGRQWDDPEAILDLYLYFMGRSRH